MLLSRRNDSLDILPVDDVSIADEYPAVIVTAIGDSITAGISVENAEFKGKTPRPSYRAPLWDLIQSDVAVPRVEFAGTTQYNSIDIAAGGKAHSSYRGFATYSFLPFDGHDRVGSEPHADPDPAVVNADGWATFDADVAMILLGVNDVIQGRTVEYTLNYKNSVEGSLKEMIGALRVDNPDVQVLLGTIPAVNASLPFASEVLVLNDMIRDAVNPDVDWVGSTFDSPIHIVDHFNGVKDLPLYEVALHSADGVHPNEEGDVLLAANWWSVLRPILMSIDVTEPHDPTDEDPTEVEADGNSDAPVTDPPLTEDPTTDPVVQDPVTQDPADEVDGEEVPGPVDVTDEIIGVPTTPDETADPNFTADPVDEPEKVEQQDSGRRRRPALASLRIPQVDQPEVVVPDQETDQDEDDQSSEAPTDESFIDDDFIDSLLTELQFNSRFA